MNLTIERMAVVTDEVRQLVAELDVALAGPYLPDQRHALSLEQLFVNRPVPGWARFRTPIDGLWLGGSAAHPGGGIMGASGRLAAQEILRARGRGRGAAQRGLGGRRGRAA